MTDSYKDFQDRIFDEVAYNEKLALYAKFRLAISLNFDVPKFLVECRDKGMPHEEAIEALGAELAKISESKH